MSTSRRTRRLGSSVAHWLTRNGLLALAVILPSSEGNAEPLAAPPAIVCTVRVPSLVERGQSIPFTVTLRNRSRVATALLNWGTPFEEAWLQPFVEVERDGRPVSYGGASVKRGDPERDEYVRLASGQRRSAQLELSDVFDFSVPGRYTVTPRLMLHDVVVLPSPLPRPRAQHVAHPLACGGAQVVVVRAAP
jgi:hypothetical protein